MTKRHVEKMLLLLLFLLIMIESQSSKTSAGVSDCNDLLFLFQSLVTYENNVNLDFYAFVIDRNAEVRLGNEPRLRASKGIPSD